MSHGPTARIFYGYDLETMTIYHRDAEEFDDRYEEIAPDWWDDEEPEDRLQRLLGLEEAPIPERFAGDRYDRDAYRTWLEESDDGRARMDQYRRNRAVIEAYPVELKPYGALQCGEPCWSVQVKASVQGVYYYESKQLITPLDVDPDWDAQLAAYVDLMGLTLPRDQESPAWHLNCSYDG